MFNPTNLTCDCGGDLESGQRGIGYEYYSCEACGEEAVYVNTVGTAFEPTQGNGWFGCQEDADEEMPKEPVQ